MRIQEFMTIFSTPPLTAQQQKIEQQIALLKQQEATPFSTLPFESLSPAQQDLARQVEAIRETIPQASFLRSLETQETWYNWGFDRPYFATEAISLLGAAAMSLAATPYLAFKAAQSGFADNTLQKLAQAGRMIALGTLLGLGKAILAPIHDTTRKISSLADSLLNPSGNAALLAIDVQYDFFDEGEVRLDGKVHRYEKGSLAVPKAYEILSPICQLNDLRKKNVMLIASQDWHPLNHYSFAANLGISPFSSTRLGGLPQTAWPIHCVQHSHGAAFVHGMPTPDLVVQKGQTRTIDSYSAFLENDQIHPTKLQEHLKANNIKTLFVFGLAYDFCVGWSAKDALKAGYEVILIEDATRGIFPAKVEETRKELLALGAQIMTAEKAMESYPHFFKSKSS